MVTRGDICDLDDDSDSLELSTHRKPVQGPAGHDFPNFGMANSRFPIMKVDYWWGISRRTTKLISSLPMDPQN